MLLLILHLLGDYLTQSHWMAICKSKRWLPAVIHASLYSIPFLLICGWKAVFVIWATHLLIDRFGLARYVVFAKNLIGSPDLKWAECKATGYPADVPLWLSVWLLIAADNTLHLLFNYAAVRWVH